GRVDQVSEPRGRPGHRRHLIVARCRGFLRHEVFDRIGIPLEKLADDDVGIKTDCERIGADERPTENPRRPVRDVVALQLFEQRYLDFRLLRNRAQSNLLFFTTLAQTSAEFFKHADCQIETSTRVPTCAAYFKPEIAQMVESARSIRTIDDVEGTGRG